MKYAKTDKAPAPLGAYEQAVIHNGMVYVSMQLPLRADGDNTALQSIEEQTTLVLENIKVILEAAGSSCEKVLKTTVYLKDINMSKRVNAAYEKYFPQHKPARTTIGVTALPLGYAVAMDVIATCE